MYSWDVSGGLSDVIIVIVRYTLVGTLRLRWFRDGCACQRNLKVCDRCVRCVPEVVQYYAVSKYSAGLPLYGDRTQHIGDKSRGCELGG